MTRTKDWALKEPGRPLNTVNFESPSHTGTLLAGLNTLRAKGHLLDVTLVAEGQAFQAHRVVLASCSDYFRAMFTDAMRESRQSEICLNGVSAAGMRLLLDYAYTSRLALNLANIQDVLSAASHIQVVAVVEACSTYLQSQLDLENCVDIATISETYSLTQLRGVVYRFMCGNLVEFARSPEFTRLHPAQLEHLLACDFPVDCPEADVLAITLRWLHSAAHENHSRGSWSPCGWAVRLLRRIHFSQVSRWELESCLRRTDQQTTRLVLAETLRQARHRPHTALRIPSPLVNNRGMELAVVKTRHRPHTALSIPSPLVNNRGMELAVVKVGGFGISGVTNEITYFLPTSGKWRHLTTIPHVEQCNFGTAVLHNDLYVVGGCFNQSLQENIHPFGFRYSPRCDSWATMAPMQQERCRFSLNVVVDRLYAVGGVSEVEEESVEGEGDSACECYDPETDSWESICPLPSSRTQHAAAALDHFLYVSGGLDRDLALNSMWRYDTELDRWECRAGMPTPRVDHAMLAVGGHLYVCGGWWEDLDSGNRVLVDTIDRYDASSDSWHVVTRVPTPRYHAGIVTVNSTIYFIGGFHSDAMFDRASAVIECYDLDTDSWTTVEKYPQDIWEHTCVTLYIPRCRDDMEVIPTPSPS